MPKGFGWGFGEVARFEGGWVKLYRSAVNEDIGKNPHCLALWTWLLSLATVFESKTRLNGEQVPLPPGSVVTGYRDLSHLTRIPLSTMKRHLDYLCSTERIRIKSGTEGSVITICNWDKYQSIFETEERERNAHETQTERQRNGDEPPNEELRIKNIYTPEFEALWNKFKTGSKQEAFKRFKKISQGKIESFLMAADCYLAECKTKKRFLKDLSSFIGTPRSTEHWLEYAEKAQTKQVALIETELSPEAEEARRQASIQKKIEVANAHRNAS